MWIFNELAIDCLIAPPTQTVFEKSNCPPSYILSCFSIHYYCPMLKLFHSAFQWKSTSQPKWAFQTFRPVGVVRSNLLSNNVGYAQCHVRLIQWCPALRQIFTRDLSRQAVGCWPVRYKLAQILSDANVSEVTVLKMKKKSNDRTSTFIDGRGGHRCTHINMFI